MPPGIRPVVLSSASSTVRPTRERGNLRCDLRGAARLCSRLRREETARRQPVTDAKRRLRSPHRAPRRAHGRGPAPAPGRARHLLAEGLRPADDALPRRLRLLHVRAAAAPRRARVPDGGRGARDRTRGSRGWLHGGAVHARRQAGAAVPGRTRGARRARLCLDTRVPRPLREARARRDRPAAAPQPGRDDAGRSSSCCGPCRRRWGSCSRRSRSAWPRRAGPTGPRPTSFPPRRLETIRLAGELRVPFTSGILIGIGETRDERIDALLALKALGERARPRGGGDRPELPRQARHAHGVGSPTPPLDEHLWSIAVARIVLGPDWHVQAPPNLAYDDFPLLLDAGIDDWGGVSPVTIDHVNPEAPWPEIERLREATRSRGLELVPRLPLYPEYVAELERWVDPSVQPAVRRHADALGYAREDRWAPGEPGTVPYVVSGDPAPVGPRRGRAGRGRARRGSSRRAGPSVPRVFAAADALRREVCGDDVTYVVTRNIQYTNVCYFRCGFCAFSKGKLAANLRGPGVPRPARRDRAPLPRRRGSGERPRSACRAASTRPSPATTTPGWSRRSARRCRGSTSTRSRRSRSGRGRRRSDLDLGDVPRAPARPRARLAAGHRRRDPRRRGAPRDLPRQGDDRPVARGARRGAPRRPALERDDHVRPRRAARALGAAPAARPRAAGALAAASPSSCRSRSCPWRRRST